MCQCNISIIIILILNNIKGKIPLRELVYRVLDLPSSMRPLVYDFGQLQKKTEDSYIDRIVSDHVRVCINCHIIFLVSYFPFYADNESSNSL